MAWMADKLEALHKVFVQRIRRLERKDAKTEALEFFS